MNKKQIIESIIHNYGHLPNHCIEDLNNCSRVFTLSKGHLLVKQGQYADKAYYISQGVARTYYLKDGKDISDWFAFENDFISSIQSFFMESPSPHFLETIEPSIILEVKRKDIDRLSDLYREFDRLVKVIVTQTMLKLQHRIVSLQFETAQQKYENLLAIKPDIEMRIPLMHIASYLGITIETLSRIRHSKIRI